MKNKLICSFFIVTFFSVLDRALGFFLKIYSSRVLGAEGMGIYQTAFSLYSVMLSLVMGGIPMITSKLTAKYAHDLSRQHKIASSALFLSFSISLILVVLFFALYSFSGIWISTTLRTALLFTLPSVVFSSVYCSLRGSLWGKEKFFLVSIVEVIEQIARISACISFVTLGFDKLNSVTFAFSVGSFASSTATLIFYLISGGRMGDFRTELPTIIKSASPITFSHLISSLSTSLTSLLIPKLFMLSGQSQSVANSMLGASMGMALPLLHIPITIVSSLAFLLIPKLGNLSGKKDNESINKTVHTAIKFACIVACCFVPIFSACGKQICALIYKDETSGYFLHLVSGGLVAISVESITVAIMNSLDMEMRAFTNGVIGYSCVWVIALVFIKSFTLNTLALALCFSWTITCILHIVSIKKRTGLKLTFLKPCAFCILLTYPVVLLVKNLSSIMHSISTLALIPICFTVACLFFFVLLSIFGIISLNFIKNPFFRKSKS